MKDLSAELRSGRRQEAKGARPAFGYECLVFGL